MLFRSNTYIFSNQNMSIQLDGSKVFYYDVISDIYGIVNLILNTSEVGPGLCDFDIYINETEVYRSFHFSDTFEIHNETTAFSFSVNNSDNLYVDVGYNDSYSKIKILAYCNLNASIYWNSTGGIFELDNDYYYYYKTIKTPKISMLYDINLIADPELPAKNLTIINSYEIKKRPTNFTCEITRDNLSQTKFFFNLSLLDFFTKNNIFNENITLYFFNYLTYNWSFVEEFTIENKIPLYEWNIPKNYSDSKLSFKVSLNNNPRYENNTIFFNLTIPMIQPLQNNNYPISTKISIKFKLELLNGTPLINKTVNISIGNNRWVLETNNEGICETILQTPDKEGIMLITIFYEGSDYIFPIFYQDYLIIKMNLSQKIFLNIGYFIAFFGLCAGTGLTLIKIKRPKRISDIKIK